MPRHDDNKDYNALSNELLAFYEKVKQVQQSDKERHHVVFKSSKGTISRIRRVNKIFKKNNNNH